MIEAPPTLTISAEIRRPTSEQVLAFQNIPTGFVVDAMQGGGAFSSTIQLLGAGRETSRIVAGPALTVDCGPGDVLASFAALKYIATGDVVVASFAGHQGCATAGDRLTGMMKNCGAASYVTDGPIRDFAGIIEVGLPVWCTGITPASPQMTGPGSVGLPIQIGGQEVETGDIIVTDRDGAVVVPFEKIDQVIQALDHIKQLEQDLDAKVVAGLKVPEWVEEYLASDKTVFLS